MRLIDADKLETTAVLGVQLQHADSRYYYFYEEETIQKAPTVKAIPIEWIEMFLEVNYPIESPYGTKAYFHDFMKGMIKEWKNFE